MKEPRRIPFIPSRPEKEVDSELRFHLEKRIQANIAAGMAADDARRDALERFGDVDGVRDECARILTEERKTVARREWLEDLWQDLRFATRAWLRSPVFTALAVITLALGIGANAAVFGVVKSVLLNSLPYADADRLMRIRSPIKAISDNYGSLSAGTISDLRERQKSFSSFGAWTSEREMIYDPGDRPQIVKARWVEPSLFTTLGVHPMLGSLFTDADGLRDTSFAVMIPWHTWQQVFGGAGDVIGRTVRINGIARTVVGVLPRNFVMPEQGADYFMPLNLALYMQDAIGVRGSHNFGMVGRLKPGVTVAAANAELRKIGDELEKLYAKDNLGIGLSGQPLRDAMVGDTKTPLLVLLASAALVLLITCANLAGALLSRTISRRKEFAVRVALGAGRGRLVRQLLTESALLSIAGAVAGVVLAMTLLGVLRGLSLQAIPSYADLSLDGGAIAVTFVVALLTGVAFGLGPAISVGRANPQGTLRDETRGSTESVRSRRMRGVLVAGQIALCVSLLAAAGLLARSLWTMVNSPLGFNTDHMLTFTVPLPGSYNDAPKRFAFKEEFEQRLKTLPGVQGVAIARSMPTKVQNSNGIFLQYRPWAANEPVPFILTSRVNDGFFSTLGIPLLAGRTFNATDAADGSPVMVINDAFAKKYFPNVDPIGQQVRYGPPDPNQPWTTVIGVVGNVRNNPIALAPEPMMFFSQRQQPFGESFAVRTSGDPIALAGTIRAQLKEIDPGLPMYQVKTMQELVAEGFTARKLPVLLMSAFGLLALLLASVGVYAMFMSMAAAREREFGVRIALGASRGSVASLVLRQGGRWMLIGLAVGAGGIALAARLVSSQLFGVPAFDPLTIGGAVLVLLACAGVALLVPVRRATQVDPITVMR
ncbi:MAG TPA: ABC transporter permease [Gemmatimonadaceae bacterium]|nr:ABC transporter permease [Gemmatimonadaceae bacterium]